MTKTAIKKEDVTLSFGGRRPSDPLHPGAGYKKPRAMIGPMVFVLLGPSPKYNFPCEQNTSTLIKAWTCHALIGPGSKVDLCVSWISGTAGRISHSEWANLRTRRRLIQLLFGETELENHKYKSMGFY